jgi:outer-membrane lipoprotein carrier protein
MKKFLLLCAFFCFSVANFDFNSLEANFTQSITSNDATINYTGRFYAREDNHALWIYEKPTPKKIYFDLNKVVVLEDELEQAIISNLKNTPNLAQILKSAKRIKDTLYKTEFDDVEYLITTKNDLPYRIDYQDKLGNKIKIIFDNIRKNITIDDGTLTPVIPSFYDIIEQ